MWLLMICPLSTAEAQIINREDIEKPLLEGERFDLVQLDNSNKGALIQIVAQNDVPQPFPEQGDLVFEFLHDSEGVLQVPYAKIANYERFNDLVVDEAIEFLDSKEYGKAFRNLLYVYDRGGKKDRQLVETLRTCLFQDAKKRFENEEFELALSIFEDLYQDKPNFRVPGIRRSLVDIIMACYDGILQQKFVAGRYKAIRETVKGLKVRYGNAAKDLTQGWDERFDQKAIKLLAEAKELANAGQGREAHIKAKQAERTSPGRPDTEEVQETLMNQFPLIVIGVSQSSDDPAPNQIDDWAARRIGRLIQRNLVEITGLSDEGARYEFLNGAINRIDDVGLVYAIDIDPTQEKLGVPKISAIQLANRLLSNANPNSAMFDPTWRRILKTVELVSDTRVIITLQRPFVRPEALMRVAYPPRPQTGDAQETEDAEQTEDATAEQTGVYSLTNRESAFSTFELNPRYQPVEGQQHPVIIEQLFRTDSDAVDALLRGEIDVVDRISPADVARLKESENIQVRSYVVPTVHFLIPKIRGDLADSFRFRSALSAAIPRDSIVVDVIGGGRKLDGCDAITGPFPLGGDDNDQISYGYDLRVKPLQFSEKLSMVLTKLAISKPGAPEDPKPPSIVMAHPASSTASQCAQAIARAWNAAGIRTTLRALSPGQTTPPDNQWDILYAETFIEEPLIDAVRLFGDDGLANDITAPVQQSLRNVVTSQTWQGACLALRNIHRQVSVDLSVIPLFQVKEHFAFRDNVYNIGRNLIHLYQNVDRWTIETIAMAQRRKAEQNKR
jgi:tetratricopeptide (TPR) repeat protein